MRRNTRSRGLSDDAKGGEARLVLCVRNEGYAAGLELRKVYRVLADEQASKRHQLRVIDESGEDYLYPEEYFCRHGIVALAVSLVGNSGAGFVGPRGA